MSYSLLEFKLRKFIYLGHTKSIYVHPTHRKTFWKNEKDSYELLGIKLIKNIVYEKKTEDIDSIIPIILKIEKENKLKNYEYLIYILAVCSKLKKKESQKMVADAYAAVGIICTDGFKLLMYFVFCNIAATILHKQRCIPKKSIGFGNGARRIFTKWYLNRNPFETISFIMNQKMFRGCNHKNIMNTIHLHSENQSHQIYITFIRNGISKMEEMFGPEMQKLKDTEGTKSLMEQLSIYNFIRQMHRIDFKMESKSLTDLKWNILGNDHQMLLPKMLQSTRVLTSFVWNLPLTTLLNNTYSFHRHGLFKNLRGNHGCMEFILRFKDRIAVKESGIHPIDSYLEYLRYERYGAVVSAIKKTKKNNQNFFYVAPDEVEPNYYDNLNQEMKNGGNELKKSCKMLHNNIHLFFMKPSPSPVKELQKFLSIDLVEKTLKNLKPSGRQLLIAYDNRKSMESVTCQYMHVRFVKVLDAIVLIIQSLVYQEKSIKPIICALFDPDHRFQFIHVNYQQKFTAKYFQDCLFENSPQNSKIHKHNMEPGVKPLNTINWARKYEKNVDVFLFLGTAGMNLKGIRKSKAKYEAFSNSKIKIIICCLNGKHSERENISRDGMLYIYGFNKNTARIIDLFINNTF